MIIGGGGSLADPGVRAIPEAEVVSSGPFYVLCTYDAAEETIQVVTRSLEDTNIDDFTLAVQEAGA
jgi:hypothetical protein